MYYIELIAQDHEHFHIWGFADGWGADLDKITLHCQ